MATKLKARKPEIEKPGHCKGVLYGPAKSGKTFFALSFPAPFYIDTEGGARLAHYQKKLDDSGGGYFGPKDGACDFDEILGQIRALASEKHHYKTLVIDSATKVFQATVARENERLGSADVWGASKKAPIAYMRRLFDWTDRLNMNVWYLAHETAKWEGEGNGRKQVGTQPDIWEKTIYELDLALQVQCHSQKFRTATVTATRLEGLPMGERFDLQRDGTNVGYDEFSKRYGRDFIEAEPVPIALATPEQVAEILRLLDVIKVPEEDIKKALTKAKAETWAEVSTERAAEMIVNLTKKVTG